MDASTLVDAYVAGPRNLGLAVAELSPEQLIARPIPGKWSVLEVICHLADTEANIDHLRFIVEKRLALGLGEGFTSHSG
jgi:DinB superfamily